MIISWDEYFMGLAHLSSLRSKDPNTQVGACIIDKDKIVLNKSPEKFEAGTLPLTQIIGLKNAVEYVSKWDDAPDIRYYIYDELSKIEKIKMEEVKMTTQEFIDAIKEMTVLELNDLVKACEEEFGVSAAAGVVVAAGGAAGGDAAEEKDEFDVELTEVGPNKVKVIKVVREVTGLGLKEAKEVVDGAPKVVKEAASKAEADEIKEKLEAEGAKVTLK